MCLYSKILKFDDGNLLLSWLPTSCPNFMLRAFFFVELLAFQIQTVPDNHGQKVRRLFWNVIIIHTLISSPNKISYAPMPLAKYWGIFSCKTCQTWKDHVPYSSLGPPCPEQVPTPSSTLLTPPPFTPPPSFYLKEGHLLIAKTKHPQAQIKGPIQVQMRINCWLIATRTPPPPPQ